MARSTPMVRPRSMVRPRTNGAPKSSFLDLMSSVSAPVLAAVGRTRARTATFLEGRLKGSPRTQAMVGFVESPSLRLALGFAIGAFGALFLAAVAAFGVSQAYDGKIMPGVRVGSVDVSGMTRDEAIQTLDAAYAGLSQGSIDVTTPTGTQTISFADAGRGPDSAAMADAAMSVGRTDDPISSTASALRSFASGTSIPVIVKLDSTRLELKIRDLTAASLEPAKDASVKKDASGQAFTVVPSATGRGIDEASISESLIEQLANPDAPSQLSVSGQFVTLQPSVTDDQAEAAIQASKSMVVDVTLTYGDKSWTIPAATIRSWILFGLRSDGTFGPVIDPAELRNYLNGIGPEITVAPIEPRVMYSKSGQPTGITAGTAGLGIDYDNTGVAVGSYLDGLARGQASTGASIAIVTRQIQPTLAENPTLAGFVKISEWRTYYYSNETNGFGANIEIPAEKLNGLVVAAGAHFSFLQAVGPIDASHGYVKGGVITNGESKHLGAMGGGICSASTTMFNAAARAGLQIDERHAHFYYIDRYPVGLDATVYSNGTTTWDMRFTNDTGYPIVIRSWAATTRAQRSITIQIYSLPNGRSVKFSTPVTTDKVAATNYSQYVRSLPAGQKTYWQEYATPGFKAFVTRTVTDPTGAVVHYDEWYSNYTKVDGMVLIVGSPPPSQTPTPTPGAPTPTPGAPTPPPATPPPTHTPAPTATPTPPRKRQKRG
jgi:vancomycin resistance protein YoaR